MRVSTEEQAAKGETGSLETQRQNLHGFIKYKNGRNDEDWAIAQEYQDIKSAKDTSRPGYQRMLSDIETGVINTILFTEISRLSRSTYDFLGFAKFMHRHGATFVCYSQPDIDTSSSTGKVLFTLLTTLMEFEREINAERSRRSYQRRASEGRWTGGRPLGYKMGKQSGCLTPDAEEKKIVRFMFQAYLKTRSLAEVSVRCEQRGYRPKERRGNSKGRSTGRFSTSSVKQILTNATYIGKREMHKQNRGKRDDYGDPVLPEYQAFSTTYWQPLVDTKSFDRVQAILDENRLQHGTPKPKMDGQGRLLTQLAICSACKAVLHISQPPNHQQYTQNSGKETRFEY